MKRIAFTIAIIIFVSIQLSAQVCTPEWTGSGSGIVPDTFQNMPPAYVNVPYEVIVQFKVPVTDTLGGIVIPVDHVELIGVTGLSAIPASSPFQYACNPTSCSFKADSVGCVKITGTPTVAGTYPLIINTKGFVTPVSFIPLNVSGYRIVVNQSIGIPSLNQSSFDVSQNIPNPVKTRTDIYVNLPKPSSLEFKVSNVLGNMVFKKIIDGRKGMNTIILDVTSFAPGLYFYTISNNEQIITKRMVVEKK